MAGLESPSIFADPRLDSRLVKLPGANGHALFLTPEDESMKSLSELLCSGDYVAARRHPQYSNSVQEGERIIAQAAADQHRAEQLCGQHNGILSMPPHIGGGAIAAWQSEQMSSSFAESKRLEGVGA